jgi:hypothetical protein
MKIFLFSACFLWAIWNSLFAGNYDPLLPVTPRSPRSPADTVIPGQTMTGLRKGPPALPSGNIYITDEGRQGFFAEARGDTRTTDDSAMTLITSDGKRYKRITDNGTVDARWFGAIPGDGKDDWAAIQKAVDFCTANGNRYSTVHLSPGLYLISQPIMLYSWGGSAYAFHSTSLEGESPFWGSSGNGTIIQCTFKDKFAIGVELGKGNRISKLKIMGGFKPPFADKFTFYQSTFDQFKDPDCRDQNFSPYAAIVIDPFSNSSGQIPPDGGYPGYASWYRGSGGVNGSTGISIEDVSIEGFVVGICSSPNSFTRNAELTNINKIQFADTKLCISGSQDQEKGNVVSNLGCWGTVHTVFATGLYGAHTPGNWYVDNANIAGYVNRLIYNVQGGYFACHFKNIFSEMLGRLGTIQSNQGTVVEASEFGFAYFSSDAGQYISPQIDCSGVTFIGCNMRMYGTFKPVTISGSSAFIGCSFETIPFTDASNMYVSSFANCTIGDYTNVLGVNGIRKMYPPLACQSFAYGDYSLAYGAASLAIHNALPSAAYPLNLSASATPLHITGTSANHSAVVALKPDEALRVRTGDVICTNPQDKVQGVIGIVTAVTAADFTISYIPSWVVSGQSYYLSIFLPLCNMTFLGDMTAGSNRITNVRADFGNFDKFISLGGLMLCNRFINTGYSQTWRAGLFRIVSYDAPSKTIVLDQQATQTIAGVYFSNGNAVKDLHTENFDEGFIFLDKYDTGEMIQEGGHIFTRDPATGGTVSYLVTKSGYYNAAANHDTRQAKWIELKHGLQ